MKHQSIRKCKAHPCFSVEYNLSDKLRNATPPLSFPLKYIVRAIIHCDLYPVLVRDILASKRVKCEDRPDGGYKYHSYFFQ